MSVREVARYLQINEKKVYALAAEGKLPGTKVTGKWLFPRDLVDQWLTRSSHGGVFTDRLVITGAEDALMGRLALALSTGLAGRGLIAYTSTGTRLGLELLSGGRCDATLVHWGLAEESQLRHPALLRHFPEHGNWILVRAFRREQGLMLAPGTARDGARLEEVLAPGLRILGRSEGSGTGRFFQESLAQAGLAIEALELVGRVASSGEAAQRLRNREADAAPASRAAAAEAGLGFASAGWETVDLALSRGLYFRTLLQNVLDALRDDETFLTAERLGGYDFLDSGKLIWAARE